MIKITKFNELKDYFPGRGCSCDARDYNECGCGVDWSPKEKYENDIAKKLIKEWLEHDLQDGRALEIISELTEWVNQKYD